MNKKTHNDTCRLHVSTYVTFMKRHNYRNREQMSGFQGLEEMVGRGLGVAIKHREALWYSEVS